MKGTYEMTGMSEKYGPAYYHTNDFRTYEPQVVQNKQGRFEQITLCESLIEDRWEGHVSVKDLGHFAKAV